LLRSVVVGHWHHARFDVESGCTFDRGGGSRNPLLDAGVLSSKCSMDRVSTVFAEMPDWPRLFASSLCCWAKLQW
jgi:hypothetical protein